MGSESCKLRGSRREPHTHTHTHAEASIYVHSETSGSVKSRDKELKDLLKSWYQEELDLQVPPRA